MTPAEYEDFERLRQQAQEGARYIRSVVAANQSTFQALAANRKIIESVIARAEQALASFPYQEVIGAYERAISSFPCDEIIRAYETAQARPQPSLVPLNYAWAYSPQRSEAADIAALFRENRQLRAELETSQAELEASRWRSPN